MTVIQPILQNSVVVFSKAYLPLARINIKRAIVLLITGQAESPRFWQYPGMGSAIAQSGLAGIGAYPPADGEPRADVENSSRQPPRGP